jgi:hypothetical protein
MNETKWRKKPVVIDARQFDGENGRAIEEWTDGKAMRGPDLQGNSALHIQTLEGLHTATIGDWIIRGVKGEFYPCKPDIFALTYDPASAPAPSPAAEAERETPNLDAILDDVRHRDHCARMHPADIYDGRLSPCSCGITARSNAAKIELAALKSARSDAQGAGRLDVDACALDMAKRIGDGAHYVEPATLAKIMREHIEGVRSEVDRLRPAPASNEMRAADPHTFCKAYDVWLKCCVEGWGYDSAQVRAIRDVRLLITKSSLLNRLVYCGETLRTEKCPKHKGRWSGIPSPGNECECGLTGWLPVRSLAVPQPGTTKALPQPDGEGR